MAQQIDESWTPEGVVAGGLLLKEGVVLPWEFVYGLVFHLVRGYPYHTFRSDRAGKYIMASGTNYRTIAHYVEKNHSTYVFDPSKDN